MRTAPRNDLAREQLLQEGNPFQGNPFPRMLKEYAMADLDKEKVIGLLNCILEQELAGVVRYTHYSLLVFGHNRIPIVSWLREQAAESLTHAQQAGEMITLLGAYPSLAIGPLLDSHQHDIGAMLREFVGDGRQGARPLSRAAPLCPGALGGSRRIRSTDGLRRGAACERGGQDASHTRRSSRLPTRSPIRVTGSRRPAASRGYIRPPRCGGCGIACR